MVVYKILDFLIRSPRVSNLSDKHVVITGCDTGFGHLLAKKLDTLKVNVYAGCYTEVGTKSLQKDCSTR